ncbi:hypothetical protein AB0L65_36000 [Nonomuraea sp. NPDC052116]|uniref:hypothetical protein n=1 Tax=Nonomuraea sp. NPDC052116 TaxID=3155665 RepID=UPI0034149309
MKLTTVTQVTIDGVMQGNGGASEEDRRNGFERGGWAFEEAHAEGMNGARASCYRATAAAAKERRPSPWCSPRLRDRAASLALMVARFSTAPYILDKIISL